MSLTRADFRLISTECCHVQLCWVNPRLPNYCPECGRHCYPTVKSWVVYRDEQAIIRHAPDHDQRPDPP